MKCYKPAEFAKMLGVSTRTLIRWESEGKIESYRTPGNQRFYTHAQYAKYCEQSGMKPEDIEPDPDDIFDNNDSVH